MLRLSLEPLPRPAARGPPSLRSQQPRRHVCPVHDHAQATIGHAPHLATPPTATPGRSWDSSLSLVGTAPAPSGRGGTTCGPAEGAGRARRHFRDLGGEYRAGAARGAQTWTGVPALSDRRLGRPLQEDPEWGMQAEGCSSLAPAAVRALSSLACLGPVTSLGPAPGGLGLFKRRVCKLSWPGPVCLQKPRDRAQPPGELRLTPA